MYLLLTYPIFVIELQQLERLLLQSAEIKKNYEL